jgi:hypothetical protein
MHECKCAHMPSREIYTVSLAILTSSSVYIYTISSGGIIVYTIQATSWFLWFVMQGLFLIDGFIIQKLSLNPGQFNGLSWSVTCSQSFSPLKCGRAVLISLPYQHDITVWIYCKWIYSTLCHMLPSSILSFPSLYVICVKFLMYKFIYDSAK